MGAHHEAGHAAPRQCPYYCRFCHAAMAGYVDFWLMAQFTPLKRPMMAQTPVAVVSILQHHYLTGLPAARSGRIAYPENFYFCGVQRGLLLFHRTVEAVDYRIEQIAQC